MPCFISWIKENIDWEALLALIASLIFIVGLVIFENRYLKKLKFQLSKEEFEESLRIRSSYFDCGPWG